MRSAAQPETNQQEVDAIANTTSKRIASLERDMYSRHESPPQNGATLSVASLAPALVLIVFTVPLTTLASTAQALGAGPSAQAWILSSMSVGAASALLGNGAIGDDYGRRRTFVAGTLVLAFSSVLGALAPDAPLLIVARIGQGLGGGAALAESVTNRSK